MAQNNFDLGIPGLEQIQVIGSGGSAVVYRAVRRSADDEGGASEATSGDEDLVAVKVLKSSWDPNAIRRFEREQRAMRKLAGYPGFVPVLETGTTNKGAPFFVMPFYEGGSLHEKISQGGPIDWPRALRLIEQVAETVGIAHRHDVYHRDLKPGNILLSASGDAHVTDFGISLIASESVDGFPTTATAFTPAYSPPEAFTNTVKPSAASDIYGLAATLWALLAGHAPFKAPGEQAAPATVFGRVAMQQVGDLRDRVPSPLCRFIEECMAKDPADRPQTVSAFLQGLRSAREDTYRGVDAPRLELDGPVAVSDDAGPARRRPGRDPMPVLAFDPDANGDGVPDDRSTPTDEETSPFEVVLRNTSPDPTRVTAGPMVPPAVIPPGGRPTPAPSGQNLASPPPINRHHAADPNPTGAPSPGRVQPATPAPVDDVPAARRQPSVGPTRTVPGPRPPSEQPDRLRGPLVPWPWPALLAAIGVILVGLLVWSSFFRNTDLSRVDSGPASVTTVDRASDRTDDGPGNQSGASPNDGVGGVVADVQSAGNPDPDDSPDPAGPETDPGESTGTGSGDEGDPDAQTPTTDRGRTTTTEAADPSTTTTTEPTTTSSTTTSTTSTTVTPQPPLAIDIVSGPSLVQASPELLVFTYTTNDVCGTGSFVIRRQSDGAEVGRWNGQAGCFGPVHEGRTDWAEFDLESGYTYVIDIVVDGQPGSGEKRAGTGNATATLVVPIP